MTRLLVAGVGNIFLGDDGFGVEVARRLQREQLPQGVRVADFGIRGVHLAFELVEGYDALLLLDALPRGGEPGTVYVMEPELDDLATFDPGAPEAGPLVDAHSMEPVSVLSLLRSLGGRLDRVIVVGCEPLDVAEGIGLSEPVARAVDEAVRVVRELVGKQEIEVNRPPRPGATAESAERRQSG